MKKLENKVAVVTGGNSGIGLSTAQLFAAQGAKVAITGRNQATLHAAVSTIGNGALGLVSDVSNLSSIDESYATISDKFGKIDVLVVNAGVFNTAPISEVTEAQFDELSDINFKGAFFTVQKALPYLNDGASVILTTSAVVHKGFATTSIYSATKAAVRSLARSLSADLLDRKIRVNVLSPGPVDTPIFGRNGVTEQQANDTKGHFAGLTPVQRLGTSKEIAEGFLYLASDDSKFMVGGELLLDGGVSTL